MSDWIWTGIDKVIGLNNFFSVFPPLAPPTRYERAKVFDLRAYCEGGQYVSTGARAAIENAVVCVKPFEQLFHFTGDLETVAYFQDQCALAVVFESDGEDDTSKLTTPSIIRLKDLESRLRPRLNISEKCAEALKEMDAKSGKTTAYWEIYVKKDYFSLFLDLRSVRLFQFGDGSLSKALSVNCSDSILNFKRLSGSTVVRCKGESSVIANGECRGNLRVTGEGKTDVFVRTATIPSALDVNLKEGDCNVYYPLANGDTYLEFNLEGQLGTVFCNYPHVKTERLGRRKVEGMSKEWLAFAKEPNQRANVRVKTKGNVRFAEWGMSKLILDQNMG